MSTFGVGTYDSSGSTITEFSTPIVAIRSYIINTSTNGSIYLRNSYGKAKAFISLAQNWSTHTMIMLPTVEIRFDDRIYWVLPTIPKNSALSIPSSCQLTVVFNDHTP